MLSVIVCIPLPYIACRSTYRHAALHTAHADLLTWIACWLVFSDCWSVLLPILVKLVCAGLSVRGLILLPVGLLTVPAGLTVV
jgi:hypothetical protein